MRKVIHFARDKRAVLAGILRERNLPQKVGLGISVCMYMCTDMYVFPYMCLRVYVCLCVCLYVLLPVCVCVCACVGIFAFAWHNRPHQGGATRYYFRRFSFDDKRSALIPRGITSGKPFRMALIQKLNLPNPSPESAGVKASECEAS